MYEKVKSLKNLKNYKNPNHLKYDFREWILIRHVLVGRIVSELLFYISFRAAFLVSRELFFRFSLLNILKQIILHN